MMRMAMRSPRDSSAASVRRVSAAANTGAGTAGGGGGSMRHMSLHPSPLTRLPSSHSSSVRPGTPMSRFPSPQVWFVQKLQSPKTWCENETKVGCEQPWAEGGQLSGQTPNSVAPVETRRHPRQQVAGSMTHKLEHPSLSMRLPSSHSSSEGSKRKLPQRVQLAVHAALVLPTGSQPSPMSSSKMPFPHLCCPGQASSQLELAVRTTVAKPALSPRHVKLPKVWHVGPGKKIPSTRDLHEEIFTSSIHVKQHASSRRQVGVHPSPMAALPSSHSSTTLLVTPSPQNSFLHCELHPSPLTRLPSSHSSSVTPVTPVSTCPSPQVWFVQNAQSPKTWFANGVKPELHPPGGSGQLDRQTPSSVAPVESRVHPAQQITGSTTHKLEHPSLSMRLPSSHSSPTSTKPLPQTSILHVEEQLSPLTVLPSSHSSGAFKTPLPQHAPKEPP